jgi:hypothetical protein
MLNQERWNGTYAERIREVADDSPEAAAIVTVKERIATLREQLRT